VSALSARAITVSVPNLLRRADLAHVVTMTKPVGLLLE
jgi:hypothetical protein